MSALKGEAGADGQSAYEIAVANGYTGTEQQWLESLVGAAGANGTDGKSAYELAVENGYEGTIQEWLDGLTIEVIGAVGKSAYELAVENGFEGSLTDWLASLKGEQGEAGQDGSDGKSAYELAQDKGYTGTLEQWLSALKGEAGADGQSAYEIAVANGYTGTEQQWLESLVGAAGANGTDGKSAYELAVENGYEGTIQEWLDGLTIEVIGAEGKSAYDLAVENGFAGTLTEWLASLKGDAGADGKDGYTPYVGSNGNWWINGIDTGFTSTGQNGVSPTIKDGVWYIGDESTNIPVQAKVEIINGNWHVNGVDTGVQAQGATGATGATGAAGKDGISPTIKDGVWYIGDESTNIPVQAKVEIINGNWHVNGVDTGVQAQGATGATGATGAAGKDGISPTIKDGVWYIGDESTNIPVQAKVEIINGNWHVNGVDTGVQAQGATGATGATGAAGKDGISPTIKDGVWYIGDESTNIPVQAKVEIINGNWHVNGVDTGVQAQGATGATGATGAAGKDGISPTIKDGVWYIGDESTNIPVQAKVEIINGNWHVNGVDTGVQAQGATGATGATGAAGKDGISPTIKDGVWYIGDESTNIPVQAKVEIINGNWHVNGVDTGVQAQGATGATGATGAAGKDGISPTIKDGVWYIGDESTNIPVQAKVEIINGNWHVNGVDTGVQAQGATGATGAAGKDGISPTIKDGVWYIGDESTNIPVQAKVEIINGNWHVNGVDTGVQAQGATGATGATGAAGKDGISPTIKDGVWYIGDESTNIPVQAKVEIINGNWHVNGVDTGVQAQGATGATGAAGKDGISPTIKDGVWYIGDESTNIPVQAKVEIINGNWHVNGVDTGVQAQGATGATGAAGKDGISPTIKDGVWYIGDESTNIPVQAKVEIINGNWHVNGVDTGVQAQGATGATGATGAAGKDGISPTIKDGVWYIGDESTNIPVQAKVEIINGNWHVNGVDTGVQAQGATGATGATGAAGKDGISPTIKDGVWYIGDESTNIPVQAKVEIINGNWHVNGVDTGVQAQGATGATGATGAAGKDGISPTIKDGVWYIGDESTNIPVQAKVEIINGNWHVNGVDTGVQAQGATGATGATGAAGKDGISPTIKDGVWYIGDESTNIPVQAKVEIINGNWHVNGVDTGVQAQGATGATGAAGKDGISPTIKDGVWYIGDESTNIPVQAKVEIINGNWHVNGVDTGVQAQGATGATGATGAAGKDGISPTIKDGVWYIGDESTNIPVQAKVEIINGNWHVNGVDTGVQAQGATGATGATGAAGKDGISPTIKDGVWYIGDESTNIPVQAKVEIINGNWHVNGVDTGVQAQGATGATGAAGKDGISPTIKDGVWYIGDESTNIPVQAKVEIINGNWHVNGVDTGVQAQGATGATGATGAAGKDGISPTIKDGVWYIGDESTNIPVQAKVEIINGNWHVNGVDTGVQAQGATGATGAAGKDGISPTIKDGVWYIGDESTNIPVQAKVEIINGNWHVNGVDTGVQAQGATGATGAAGKDGISPTIKDGVWYIGDESTNIPVQAKVEIINGNWHVNGVDTGVQASRRDRCHWCCR
ncbi:hypothetical protein [Acinetobacter indicus]|uniref:hypothetical protein n=1 Tax=Acinetobacter indicus TaxID=756892 RepID=UPI001C095A26|nr:hypothetical protein [Acinetobacter indicus]